MLVLLAIIVVILLVVILKRKPIVIGTVIEKDISRCNIGNSYVTIKTATGRDVLLAFDTYAKIGCKHFGILGSSECFHDKGLELDESIRKGTMIKVQLQEKEGEEAEARYVHRRLPFGAKLGGQ